MFKISYIMITHTIPPPLLTANTLVIHLIKKTKEFIMHEILAILYNLDFIHSPSGSFVLNER